MTSSRPWMPKPTGNRESSLRKRQRLLRKPPLNDRVMHGFNIVTNRLKDRHAEVGSKAAVLALHRLGSFMSLPLLAKRMLLSADELDGYLEEAVQEGLVAIEDEEHAGHIARLTDAGEKQAAVWKAERDADTAEFLSALSDEEKETLEYLIHKMLGLRKPEA